MLKFAVVKKNAYQHNMNYKKIFRRKNINELLQSASKQDLQRTLGSFQLVMLGIGAIVGAGIFVLTGTAASTSAGPAVVISFIIGSIACACAAMCYAELSSAIPISGGAYSYAYVTLGELAAWLIGSMILVGNIFMIASVAVGWSGYMSSFLEQFNISLPYALTHHTGQFITLKDGSIEGGLFNLLSLCIIIPTGFILYKGTETSATFNNIIVTIKVIVLTLFVCIGAMYVNPENWIPFIPEHIPETGQFGIQGILGGSAIVFLAFNGFDTVASAAQETKNPQRDLPIGVIGSLLISALIYILVSGVLTGLVSYKDLNTPQPMALAVNAMNMPWFAVVVKIGAILGLGSVTLVMTYAVVRIAFTMSNDGLLPPILKKIHHKNKTPHYATMIITAIICLLAATCPLDMMVQLGNFCVIFVFIIVSVMAIYLRYTQPELKREFKCPMMPFIPLAGISLFILFLFNMPDKNIIIYFFGLMVVSAAYYFITQSIKKDTVKV
jgi:APA family basic amino acid/polyamine antiporter